MNRRDYSAALSFFREICAIFSLLAFFTAAGTWIGYLT